MEITQDLSGWTQTNHESLKVKNFLALKVLVIQSLQNNSAQLFAIAWTVACRVPLSMEFSGQEHWSG